MLNFSYKANLIVYDFLLSKLRKLFRYTENQEWYFSEFDSSFNRWMKLRMYLKFDKLRAPYQENALEITK